MNLAQLTHGGRLTDTSGTGFSLVLKLEGRPVARVTGVDPPYVWEPVFGTHLDHLRATISTAVVAALGTAIDDADDWIAACLADGAKDGITAAPPGRLQLPAEVRSRLGVEPDSDIAKSLGLHPSTPVIRRWRDEFGIPPGTRGGKGKARKTRSERDADLESAYPGLLPKLGQFSDRELAREFGLSPSAVRKARSSRNIPTARKL